MMVISRRKDGLFVARVNTKERRPDKDGIKGKIIYKSIYGKTKSEVQNKVIAYTVSTEKEVNL